jgi:hypothetical protein
MNGIDRFSFHPSGIILFDNFRGATLDAIWGTPVEVGTLITIGAGYVKFAHAGAAVAGLSILPFGRNFGVQTYFEADIQAVAGVGMVNLSSGIRLYANVDNWIMIGPYISGAETHAIALNYSVDGVTSSVHLLSGAVDDLVRRVRLAVLENHVLVYVNGIRMYDVQFTDLARDFVDYAFQLVTGTTAAADVLDVRFSNIKISNKIEDPEPYPARFKGTISLANTTPVSITFPASENSDIFELVMGANLGEGYMPYAWSLDAAATYDDIAAECNNLTTGDIDLLPDVPANDDAVFFGADEKFWCIDVYMDGGVDNTDNVFDITYWDGSAWTSIPGVTDGTNGGTAGRTFYQNGRIYFSPPADWATVAVNGVTAYWVKIVVTTFGVDIPKATHIQLGFNAGSYFDHHAAFLSTLMVKMKRNFPTAGYARFYSDAMPYLQCLGERNVDINGWRCEGSVQVSFELSATPAKTVTIEYFGFTRRL